jgi:hypothetical protein
VEKFRGANSAKSIPGEIGLNFWQKLVGPVQWHPWHHRLHTYVKSEMLMSKGKGKKSERKLFCPHFIIRKKPLLSANSAIA